MLSAFGAALLYSQHTDVTKLQFWAAVGAIAGVFLFLRGFSMLRCKRLIMNTPSSKIRSASMGLVEISGTAKGPQTVPAGITGEACYYYRAMAWQLKYSGRNREWKKVADESLYVPFFIEDATGDALVDPQGAELDIHCNFKDELGGSSLGSGMMPENASRVPAALWPPLAPKKFALEEYCIKPGDPLFVLGTLGQNTAAARWTPMPACRCDGLVIQISHELLRAHGQQHVSRVRLGVEVESAAGRERDRPHRRRNAIRFVDCRQLVIGFAGRRSHARDGRRTRAAKQPALPRQTLRKQPPRPQASKPKPRRRKLTPMPNRATGFNMHPTVAIGKGTNHEFFMISWHSQREVVQSLAWKSALCIWGGPALTLACVYFLILSLGWT